jgi:uncharacterized protein (TIGR04255 family)
MSQEPKYSKPFLADVIVRIDYTSPIDDINLTLPKQISNKALEFFPIFEPKDIITQDMLISPEVGKVETITQREWNYYGKNREKRLALTSKCCFIDYSKYESFEQLKKEFMNFVKLLFEMYADLQVMRFGLRYINNIKLDEPNLTDWKIYLGEILLSIFDISDSKEIIARVFNNLILKYDDIFLNFRYGMPNPDFPAPISQKMFVMDFDAYYSGPQDYNDLTKNIDTFHERIQKLFESLIKEPLREKMK